MGVNIKGEFNILPTILNIKLPIIQSEVFFPFFYKKKML